MGHASAHVGTLKYKVPFWQGGILYALLVRWLLNTVIFRICSTWINIFYFSPKNSGIESIVILSCRVLRDKLGQLDRVILI